MPIKSLLLFLFSFFLVPVYAQIEENEATKIFLNSSLTNTYTCADAKFNQLASSTDLFTSVDPAIYIELGIDEAAETATTKQQDYTCDVTLAVTPIGVSSTYDTQNITLSIWHNIITNEQFVNDFALYKVPGIHKATISVSSVVFKDKVSGQVLNIASSPLYLKFHFSTKRYYNLNGNSPTNLFSLVLDEELVKYTGFEATITDSDGVSGDKDELKINWSFAAQNSAVVKATEYEVEWSWVDNFSTIDINTALPKSDIILTEEEFSRNSTRVQTTNNYYNIPLTFSKGYLIYRVRPVGRFLDETEKLYFGAWTSGVNPKVTVNDWPHVLEISQNYEGGGKNWQYQSSYAEDGKKKEVVSYFDGSLRNRQTVTRMNTNNQAIAGEVIYDTQGRPAIEVLPVPLESSAIKFYDGLNKNIAGSAIYNHNNFDWDPATFTCVPPVISGMSNTAGASKYYSGTVQKKDNYQDYVPNAGGYPFSQIEYTPDNTGRIRRKGGVGLSHQIGGAHEMRYFYGTADQPELNRLFGYNVGYAIRYKKNIVIDPNSQLSVSYIDPSGKTIATALVGDTPTNIVGLDEANAATGSMVSSLLMWNKKTATGTFGALKDGLDVNTQIDINGSGWTLQIDYGATSGVFHDACMSVYYPFVYNYDFSLKNDCGDDIVPTPSETSGTLGIFNLSGSSSTTSSLTKSFAYSPPIRATYTFSKKITVDAEALEKYADDYITKLSDPENPCYVNPSTFNPALESNCNVTCHECEAELVAQYLTGNDLTAFQAIMTALPVVNGVDEVGNTNTRQSYILLAQSVYIIESLKSYYSNDTFHYSGSTLQYTNPEGVLDAADVTENENRFKQQFLIALNDCRDLCGTEPDGTVVIENMMLADLRKGGQYGSVTGLEYNGSLTDEEYDAQDVDALSIYNENNSFYFEGYTTNTVYTEEEGEITETVSNASWRFPATPYADEFGTPAKIKIYQINENVYNPPITGGTLLPGDEDGTYYVYPQQLQNIGDFLNYFEPSWAKSLLPFHPEYPYYEYSKIISETVAAPLNISSEEFDNLLKGIDTYDEIYNGITVNGQTVTLDKLLSNTYNTTFPDNNTVDPFYKTQYSFENNALYTQRRALKSFALGYRYEGVVINTNVNLNMLQVAAYSTIYGNGMGITLSATDIQNIGKPLYLQTLPAAKKDQIWKAFRSSYLSFKQKIKTVYSNIYAGQQHRYNGCIGDLENTDTFGTTFEDYDHDNAVYSGTSNLYANILLSIVQALDDNLSGGANTHSVCSTASAGLYANKVKRYIDPASNYNSGAPGNEAAMDGVSDVQVNYYLQTGKCPLALEMESFLNGLVNPAYSTGLLANVPSYQIPNLSSALYTALTGNATAPSTSNIGGVISGSTLTIKIDTVNAISLSISSTGNTGCGNTPTWGNYLSGFRITGFKDIYYVPNSYDDTNNTYIFRIVATIERIPTPCGATEEIIIQGTTRAAVGECSLDPDTLGPGGTLLNEESMTGTGEGCTKRIRFEKALVRLMNRLRNAELFDSASVTLNLPETGGVENDAYGYMNSILPEMLLDNGGNATWSHSGNTYTISAGTSVSINISLASNFQNVTNITITDPNTIAITYTYTTTSGDLATATATGTFTYNANRFSFDCNCTEKVSIQGAQAIYMTRLLNHLWKVRDNIPSNPYLPSPYIDDLTPYFNGSGLGVYDFSIDTTNPTSQLWSFTFSSRKGCLFTLNLKSLDLSAIIGFSNLKFTGANFQVDVAYKAYTDNGGNHPAGVVRLIGKADCFEGVCGSLGNANLSLQEGLEPVFSFYYDNDEATVVDAEGMQEFAQYLSFYEAGETYTVEDVLLTESKTGTQLTFSYLGYENCPVYIDIPYPYANRFDILQFTTIAVDLDTNNLIAICLLNNNTTVTCTGHISCLYIDSCMVDVKVPCTSCVPVVPDVVTCQQGYDLLLEAYDYVGYTPLDYFTREFFCESNLQYVAADYLYYIYNFGVGATTNPHFITIQQFASTALGYGNINTSLAINEYFQYVDEGGTLSWSDYVSQEFMVDHDVCPTSVIRPTPNVQVEFEDPCVQIIGNINGTYQSQLYDNYLAEKREAFKQQYLEQALTSLTETLTSTIPDKEYQYTLYYYDQAGNLVQTVPPEGVKRLATPNTTAIDTARDTNTENTDVLPVHTLPTQYRYNSLNQLVWQQTPDGGVTKFAYDKLGRIIASQNDKQRIAFDGFPTFTTDASISPLNNNLLKSSSATSAWVDAHTGSIITGDGYVEFVYNAPTSKGYMVGLAYTNNVSLTSDVGYGVDIQQNNVPLIRKYNALQKTLPTAVLGDIYRIERKGTTIYVYKNGNEEINFPNISTAPMIVDASIYTPAGQINNIHVVSYSNGDKFSYTRYDGLGRIYEAGEISPVGGTATTPLYKINDEGRLIFQGNPVDNFEGTANHVRREVTRTKYDTEFVATSSLFTNYSFNTRNRVTAVTSYDEINGSLNETELSFDPEEYKTAIFYDYDIHGNVKELISAINDTDLSQEELQGFKYKKVKYDYDLISGNVNKVTYQPGEIDQFIHKYNYDADNRITDVFTSKDDVIWEKDANYKYYEHGPLARLELGDKKVQGLDYIYTLHGWLKAVNSEKIGAAYDAGKDGLGNVARDAFAFALNYYLGDYSSRYHGTGNEVDKNLQYYTKGVNVQGAGNLYNGNIKEMVTSITDLSENPLSTQFNAYIYDQLNRLRVMSSKSIAYNAYGVSGTPATSYGSTFNYDRNGNFKTLSRTMVNSAGTIVNMDYFTYKYLLNTNKLTHITDSYGQLSAANYAPASVAPDLTTQNPYNYNYDAIGQLTKDYGEGLTIDWRVDGKVKSVTKTNGTVISFGYDGLGNRISKSEAASSGVVTTTYYSRDAQGNVMSTYTLVKDPSLPLSYRLEEQDIYGSSRLGIERPNRELINTAKPSTLRMASSESEAQAAMVPAGEPIMAGLNFTGGNSSQFSRTLWSDTDEALNFWDNTYKKTRKFTINTRLKLHDLYISLNETGNLCDLQGGGYSPIPADIAYESRKGVWYRSNAKILIKRVDDSNGNPRFIPIIVLEKCVRRNRSERKGRKISGRKRYYYFSYTVTTTTYTLKNGIPTGEWDFNLVMTAGNSGYTPKLTINDNIYNASDFVIANATVKSEPNVHTDREYETPPGIINSLGQRDLQYYAQYPPFGELGIKADVCDFSYSYFNTGAEPYHQNFTFDDFVPANTLASTYSDSGVQMLKPGVSFTEGWCGNGELDTDGDGVKNDVDNCPYTFNPDQLDTDGDGVGDLCDNCTSYNPLQTDNDHDGVGDMYAATLPDGSPLIENGVQVYYGCDNCNNTPNFDQADSDSDGVGDVCDNCVNHANLDQADANHNGVGDICEGYDQGTGTLATMGTPVNVGRQVGDKQYELSNHLGDVMEVITDRKLVGGNQAVVPILNNTFSTGTDGWLKHPATTSIAAQSGRLEVVTAAGHGGVYRNVVLEVGSTYSFSVDLTKNNVTGYMYCYLTSTAVPGISLQPTITIANSTNITFTATIPAYPTPSATTLSCTFTVSPYSDQATPSTYFLDNFKVEKVTGNFTEGYKPDVVAFNDYYPFGMPVPNRHGTSQLFEHRYGYQGQEKDDEIKGEGNSMDFGARMYDPRIGRWFATDPLFGKYPNFSPYTHVENNPIYFKDIGGKDAYITIEGNTITVHACIVVNNSGKNQIDVAQAQNDIMKYWGGNFKDSSNKYNVKFDIVVVEATQADWDNPSSLFSEIAKYKGGINAVLPQDKDSEGDDFRSYVLGRGGNLGYWRKDERGSTYAHEVGHFFGLNDLYEDMFSAFARKPPKGKKVKHVTTFFYDQSPTELMAIGGDSPKGEKAKVSLRSIDAIVDFALKNNINGKAYINVNTVRAYRRGGLAEPTRAEIERKEDFERQYGLTSEDPNEKTEFHSPDQNNSEAPIYIHRSPRDF